MTTYKTKKAAIAAAAAVGLPTHGTQSQIEARIKAWEEAESDTADALNAHAQHIDGDDLGPIPSIPSGTRPWVIDPVDAIALGSALGIAAHLLS